MRKLLPDDLLVAMAEEAWGMEIQDLALHLVVVAVIHRIALHLAMHLHLGLEVLLVALTPTLPKIALIMTTPDLQAKTLLAIVILGALVLERNQRRNLFHLRMIHLEMHLRMTLLGIIAIARTNIDTYMTGD